VIDLFQAADTDGGIGYLTTARRRAQITSSLHPWLAVSPGRSITVFSNNWALTNLTLSVRAQTGTARVTLTVKQGTNKIAETYAYIQVKDIKNLYERWTVGDDPRSRRQTGPSRLERRAG